MSFDWLPRLKGHADLMQRLVKEVPNALERPGLQADQASRLLAVINKGALDFDQVLQMMKLEEVDESYRRAADRLADIWSNLSTAATNKLRVLQNEEPSKASNAPIGDTGEPAQSADHEQSVGAHEKSAIPDERSDAED